MMLRRRLPVLLAALMVLAIGAPSAHAGRLIESGHDMDFHCARNGLQCNFVKVSLTYVRGGAPDPTKPVLVLDRIDLDMRDAIDAAFGAGHVPMVVVDPRSPAFNTTPINTANWSAIAVASDKNCGGCDLNEINPSETMPQTQDSDRIEARVRDIATFFDEGGGLLVGSGADNGDGHAGDSYYEFVATSGGGVTSGPFTVTSLGQALGITNADVNCLCGTHNSFRFPPAGSRLKTAEVDGAGNFVTLFEDTDAPRSTISAGPPALTPSTSATFSFHASENLTSAQCSLDGAAFAACTSPATFSGLAEGHHQIAVRATDLASNVETTPPTFGWTVAFDRDGDGFTRFSPKADCNDNNAKIHPGAKEIPGNKVDENCDGVAAPFGRVRTGIRFAFTPNHKVDTLNVVHVPSTATIKTTCRGGGCAFRTKTMRKPRRTVHLASLFRGRALRVGAKIEVEVTQSGHIGKVERFTILSKTLPHFQDLCRQPGGKPARTCSLYKGG